MALAYATLAVPSDAWASTAGREEAPAPIALSETAPPHHRLSPDQALETASALPRMRRLRIDHPKASPYVYLLGRRRWQVSWLLRDGEPVGEVVLADETRKVLEQWTGIQARWMMARGRPGAFGGQTDALYVWLPLSLLFLLPFVDWRRPLRLLHLDLLALLAFSVSFAFFDHGLIFESVPLAYPPLIYVLVRMLVLGLRRQGATGAPIRLGVRTRWLAVGVVLIATFRIVLNVTDGNVIDVGYAGVIGAQRIIDGKQMYGGYPRADEHGDTYGPFNYEAYVPFNAVLGWSGTWDSLPAAHAAAITFDLASLLLLFLLGMRIRGPTLGVALAWAWVTYPFTLLAMNSDSNDALVAAMILAALLAASSSPARGALSALAGLTKIAPFALIPLLASDRLRALRRGRRARGMMLFAAGFALAAAASFAPALAHDSLTTIWQRTVAYQSARPAPFSAWGLYGLQPARLVVDGLAVALALALALLPRRAGLPALAACSGAIIIALQLGLEYWFYLYIPWFFPLAAIAFLADARERARVGRGRPPLRGRLRLRRWSAAGAASGPARSHLPSGASSS